MNCRPHRRELQDDGPGHLIDMRFMRHDLTGIAIDLKSPNTLVGVVVDRNPFLSATPEQTGITRGGQKT